MKTIFFSLISLGSLGSAVYLSHQGTHQWGWFLAFALLALLAAVHANDKK